MIKRTNQQEDIILVNICTANIRAPEYARQVLMDIKGEINRNTLIVGDFNTLLTSIGRSSRKKINKERAALHDALDQMDLIDIFRAFHLEAAEYTYFSSAHGMFSRINHMLGHKTSLNRFKKIEIVSSLFSPQGYENRN